MKYLLLAATISLAMFIIASCGKKESKINPDNIKGSWYLNQWATYQTLAFYDSTIFIDNNIDTVFTLKYFISHNSLITWTNMYSDRIYANKIIRLTEDTLVLDGIHSVKERRIYSRAKTKDDLIGEWGIYVTGYGDDTDEYCNACPRILFKIDGAATITNPGGEIEQVEWKHINGKLIIKNISSTSEQGEFSDGEYSMAFEKQGNGTEVMLTNTKTSYHYRLRRRKGSPSLPRRPRRGL